MSTWSSGNPFAEIGCGLPDPYQKSKNPHGRLNSQAKGKRAERQLANWWKVNGFPDAHRAVVTGDRFAPDGGDLVLEHGDFRLVIEVKHHAGGLTDGQVAEYGAKLLRQVAQSKGTMGILVERRDRVPDPGRWWVYPQPAQYASLLLGAGLGQWLSPGITVDCRTTVAWLAKLLRDAGLAQVTP